MRCTGAFRLLRLRIGIGMVVRFGSSSQERNSIEFGIVELVMIGELLQKGLPGSQDGCRRLLGLAD